MVESEHGRDSGGELFTDGLLPPRRDYCPAWLLRLGNVAGLGAGRHKRVRPPMIRRLLLDGPLDADFLHDFKSARSCQDADDTVVAFVAGVFIDGLFHS